MYKAVLFSRAVLTATVCLTPLITEGILYLWHVSGTTKQGDTPHHLGHSDETSVSSGNR